MKLDDMLGWRANPTEIYERLLTHIVVMNHGEHHWIWQHTHNDDGQFYLTAKEVAPLPRQVHPKGKNVSARRLMYLLFYNIIPDDAKIKTLCNVKACLNPEHLTISGQEEWEQERLEKIQAEGIGLGGEAAREIHNILTAQPLIYKGTFSVTGAKR
jgi:hypothetical protein